MIETNTHKPNQTPLTASDRPFIHPQAIVETSSENVGARTRVWAFAHVMEGVIVGRDCNIGEHSFLESGVVVGDRVTVKNHVLLWAGVTLGNDVFIGPGVVFTNDLYPRSPRFALMQGRYATKHWLQTTTVERGAAIGANATLLCGITVGAFSLVGAGALITADVAPLALMAGNPAKIRGWVCLCAQPLPKNATHYTCACGTRIEREPQRLTAINDALDINVTTTL